MKLLITTQSVDLDDPVLGFFHVWIEALSKHYEKVTVICLREGVHTLPSNVTVLSLGKEKGEVSSLVYAWRFVRYIVQMRKEYDVVFVHMNPEYIVLCGLYWRALRKKIVLWYTHKSVDLKLRIAVAFANVVLTASKESFRLDSKKARVVGHGIEIPKSIEKGKSNSLRVLTAGRITKSKHLLEMLDAMEVLAKQQVDFTFTIVGAPATREDKKYELQLREKIKSGPLASGVMYLGGVPNAKVMKLLAEDADVFLNLSTTGSLDKAVLEALAHGVPAVSSNEAFREVLDSSGLFVEHVSAEKVVSALNKARAVDPEPLRDYVRMHHSLANLIPKIVSSLS